MRRLLLLTGALGCAGAYAAEAANDAPIAVRNVAPAALVHGVPAAAGGYLVTDGVELSFSVDIANNFVSEADGSTLAFFDGETLIATYGIRRRLGGRFEIGAEIPYVIHHGGWLDGTIQEFHELLGLDDDGRPLASRNRIDYFVRHDGEVRLDFQDSRRHLGDVRVTAAFALERSSARALALRGQLKLPTGDARRLTGSEATDAAVWLDYVDRALLGRFGVTMTASGGMAVLGRGELTADDQERVVGFGQLGVSYGLTDRVRLIAQLDGHTRLANTGVAELGGAALMGTFGGRFAITPKLDLDVALTEDLAPDSTSDVVVKLALTARL